MTRADAYRVAIDLLISDAKQSLLLARQLEPGSKEKTFCLMQADLYRGAAEILVFDGSRPRPRVKRGGS